MSIKNVTYPASDVASGINAYAAGPRLSRKKGTRRRPTSVLMARLIMLVMTFLEKDFA